MFYIFLTLINYFFFSTLHTSYTIHYTRTHVRTYSIKKVNWSLDPASKCASREMWCEEIALRFSHSSSSQLTFRIVPYEGPGTVTKGTKTRTCFLVGLVKELWRNECPIIFSARTDKPVIRDHVLFQFRTGSGQRATVKQLLYFALLLHTVTYFFTRIISNRIRS